ncbi:MULTISPECIES: hypothetical protein [unclassified Salinivibrio]|uniref:hypothetical protein n=2 Tax=unclassified Salinivibrio TaxID=2636825 RepID=UPI00128C3639|nr:MULTISPECIES: hypothetical protein [unclassified Salinivibrio]MPS31479.1 hypothetical protein [Salinivibrio sp. VYel7]MPX90406.1 hypothetical protein [Salinivibrio sp. VYel1]MPX92874.1 hypothetical protein [Salinivibrio sp. VYel9]MPX95442.1 hypothetical protein [Salinivibrio sp. VYel6]MPX99092.1 hypothetical protein [Salinivibrio sp. VYel4]
MALVCSAFSSPGWLGHQRPQLIKLVVAIFLLGLVGCAPRTQPVYQPSGTDNPSPMPASRQPHRSVELAMRAAVRALLDSQPLQSSPVTLVQPIQNLSNTYFPTQRYSEQLEAGLVSAGRITPVPEARVKAVRQSLGLAQNQALVDPSTIVQYGRMLGAEYQLSGKIIGGSPHRLRLQLMDLHSGVIAWQGVESFVSE